MVSSRTCFIAAKVASWCVGISIFTGAIYSSIAIAFEDTILGYGPPAILRFTTAVAVLFAVLAVLLLGSSIALNKEESIATSTDEQQ